MSDPVAIGLLAFAVTFGGMLLGMALRGRLPEHHVEGESKDAIKVGAAFIATMSALVLGLVTASAKSSFDEVASAVRHSAVEILALDSLLVRYGEDAAPIRGALKGLVAARLDALWQPVSATAPRPTAARVVPAADGERLVEAIRRLAPHDEAQRALQTRALDLSESLLQARWAALAGTPTVAPLFLAVLLAWLGATFASYGLFAPRNATVVAAMFLCASSVAGALFLVLEMDGPFDGFLRVPADPIRQALNQLGR